MNKLTLLIASLSMAACHDSRTPVLSIERAAVALENGAMPAPGRVDVYESFVVQFDDKGTRVLTPLNSVSAIFEMPQRKGGNALQTQR